MHIVFLQRLPLAAEPRALGALGRAPFTGLDRVLLTCSLLIAFLLKGIQGDFCKEWQFCCWACRQDSYERTRKTAILMLLSFDLHPSV